jgi:hypothetical protein
VVGCGTQVGAPSLGDFNNDGVVDIVVVTATSVQGFAIERRANVGGALFMALVAILVVILGAVWVVNFVDLELEDNPRVGDQRWVRSTDVDNWEYSRNY